MPAHGRHLPDFFNLSKRQMPARGRHLASTRSPLVPDVLNRHRLNPQNRIRLAHRTASAQTPAPRASLPNIVFSCNFPATYCSHFQSHCIRGFIVALLVCCLELEPHLYRCENTAKVPVHALNGGGRKYPILTGQHTSGSNLVRTAIDLATTPTYFTSTYSASITPSSFFVSAVRIRGTGRGCITVGRCAHSCTSPRPACSCWPAASRAQPSARRHPVFRPASTWHRQARSPQHHAPPRSPCRRSRGTSYPPGTPASPTDCATRSPRASPCPHRRAPRPPSPCAPPRPCSGRCWT